MKTSAIRHPKKARYLQIHEWQIVACKGSIPAVFILSYLEYRFNELLEQQNKNGGIIELTLTELKTSTFIQDDAQISQAIKLLCTINFISLISPASPGDKSNNIKLRFNGLDVNRWIDEYQKPTIVSEVQEEVNIWCFYGLLAFVCENVREVELKPERDLLVKFPESDKKKAENLFDFWKYKTNHPRSRPQDLFIRKICDRLKDGYSQFHIALGIIGLTFSSHHMGQNDRDTMYDHIKYVVGDVEKLDRMATLAIRNGITEEGAQVEFESFLEAREDGSTIEQMIQPKKRINPRTGQEIK